GEGFRGRPTIGFEQFLGLAFQLIEVGVLAHGARRRFLTHMSSFPGRAIRRAPLLPAVRCAGPEKSSFHTLLRPTIRGGRRPSRGLGWRPARQSPAYHRRSY